MTSTDASSIILRVSPYARISDTDEERAPGIDRQLRIVCPLIESRGGVVTPEYIDNDKSAYQENVVRDEGFEPWLADFIAGKNDGIAAFDLDRLFRQTTDLNRVIKAYCDAYKAGRPKPVLWLPSSSIDLTDEDGQLMATVLVAMAKNSSSKTAKRIGSFYRDEAMKGKVYSNHPAFYRNPDGTINEAKAIIARKAIADVLAHGRRPTAIATEWRDGGITTAYGGRVTGETVRRILTSPGIAGLTVYKRELLLDTDGQPIKRLDGGITDETTWRALCEKLATKPGRRERMDKGLLTHVLRCGACGSRMARMRRSDTFFTYNCRSVDSGGCAKISISGLRLDAQVTGWVLERLNQPIQTPEPRAFDGEARLTEVTKKIAELMDAYRRPADDPAALPGSIVFPSIKQLEDEQRLLQRAQAKHTNAQRRVTTVAEEWPTLTLDRQQAVLAELFEAIVISPAKKPKAGQYDESRAQPIWRELDEARLERLYGILGAVESVFVR